jgi:hypothetical protein
MPRTLDQRYVPTDLRSRVIHFLWSIGFKYEGTRGLAADTILRALKEEKGESANILMADEFFRERMIKRLGQTQPK